MLKVSKADIIDPTSANIDPSLGYDIFSLTELGLIPIKIPPTASIPYVNKDNCFDNGYVTNL